MLTEIDERNANQEQQSGDIKMYKMINIKGRLTKTARKAFADAYITGGALETIIFPNAFADDLKYEQITYLMKSINFEWHTFIAGNNEDIYVVRRWFYEAVADRSKAAAAELAALIPGFDKADL